MSGAGRADIHALADATVRLCQDFYQTREPIELYRPAFDESDETAIARVLSSGWVAMGGEPVHHFEQAIKTHIGVAHAVATHNATAGLDLALKALRVGPGDLVITQSNTFIAPVNAIVYQSATPFFIDVDTDTLGMSPVALAAFFEHECEQKDGQLVWRATQQRVAACLPVHVLGLPCRITEIQALCDAMQVPVVEDAAEALGSAWHDGTSMRPCGSLGQVGVISFNANKIITTGSGGMVLTDDEALAHTIRHWSRLAKVSHPYRTEFDAVGYNHGMPAINASLGLAQWSKFDRIMASKKALAQQYRDLCNNHPNVSMAEPIEGAIGNDWMVAMIFDQPEAADAFIQDTRAQGVLTRPLWQPLHQSCVYNKAPRSDLTNTEWLSKRVVQLPSAPCL